MKKKKVNEIQDNFYFLLYFRAVLATKLSRKNNLNTCRERWNAQVKNAVEFGLPI